MEGNVLTLLERFSQLEPGERYVIGIDGLSRSGKTTFTQRIKQHFLQHNTPVFVFHMDEYIVERMKRYNTDFDEWYEYYQLQWDIKWLKENLFKKLKASKQLTLLKYDEKSDKQNLEVIELPETCIIFVEGVFLQRSEWRTYFDYMIYIDCPREKRFSRESEVTQKNMKKFEKRYWQAEDYYLMTVTPKRRADLIIYS